MNLNILPSTIQKPDAVRRRALHRVYHILLEAASRAEANKVSANPVQLMTGDIELTEPLVSILPDITGQLSIEPASGGPSSVENSGGEARSIASRANSPDLDYQAQISRMDD